MAVTVLGVVVTGFPSKVIVTAELGSNPVPVTVTEVPTGPEVGLIVMVGERVVPDVVQAFVVFHQLFS